MSAQEQSIECTNCGRENPATATYCSRCGSSLGGEIDPLLGKQVGKYVMQQRIGAGGSGTVYRGAHADLGRRVAIKVLLPNLVTDDESQARFEREAKVLAGLEHSNIVTIIDVGYVSGVGPYMVMEWLDGVTLFEARRQRRFLEFHEILPIFDQLTSALSYMHHSGVVHRDLKPENMMLVSRTGQSVSVEDVSTRLLKLYDFGIALFTAGDDRKLTAAGMVVGTPHYMAPEQIIVDAPVDYRADIYAVGAILFELISGRPPFWGAKRPVEVMERHLRHDPPNLQELLPERTIPHGVQGVIRRVLAKKPDERFQDARELYEALEEAVQGPTFQPYRLDEINDRTVVRSTDLWEMQAQLNAHWAQEQNPAMQTPWAPVVAGSGIQSTQDMRNLPFPPLAGREQTLNTPIPGTPGMYTPHSPHTGNNPIFFHPSSSSPQIPAMGGPFAAPGSGMSAPSGHGMVPQIPSLPSGVNVSHYPHPTSPPVPLRNPGGLDSAPTTPGMMNWQVRGEKTTEESAIKRPTNTRRWLFGLIALSLGMLLIFAFYFLAQYFNTP